MSNAHLIAEMNSASEAIGRTMGEQHVVTLMCERARSRGPIVEAFVAEIMQVLIEEATVRAGLSKRSQS